MTVMTITSGGKLRSLKVTWPQQYDNP